MYLTRAQQTVTFTASVPCFFDRYARCLLQHISWQPFVLDLTFAC
jgi:hypothetical protein